MKNKKYQIVYYNDWGNRVELHTGTREECEAWFDAHVYFCESKDAHIEKYYFDPGREYPVL